MKIKTEKPICPWCQNNKGKTDLNFSVIDDDAGQYIPARLINYCFKCGRKLKEEPHAD